MPKVIINKDKLPPISVNDEGYNLRIRLISQDRNRTSFWTPLYTVSVPESASVNAIVHIINTGSGKVVNLVWEDPSNKEFDIYVNWKMTNGGTFQGWEYKGSTLSNTWQIIDPGAHSFMVAIQKVTYPKIYSNRYDIFTSAEINI